MHYYCCYCPHAYPHPIGYRRRTTTSIPRTTRGTGTRPRRRSGECTWHPWPQSRNMRSCTASQTVQRRGSGAAASLRAGSHRIPWTPNCITVRMIGSGVTGHLSRSQVGTGLSPITGPTILLVGRTECPCCKTVGTILFPGKYLLVESSSPCCAGVQACAVAPFRRRTRQSARRRGLQR